MSNAVRVLVVDDSAFMRRVIPDMLSTNSSIEVVGTARNGQDALEKARELQPDLITLDIEMPVMDGLSALPKLLAERPVPVIMLSSHTQEGAKATLEALAMGAIDFIPKPTAGLVWDINKIEIELVDKVLSAAKARVPIVRGVTQPRIDAPVYPRMTKCARNAEDVNCVVAIGSSTGGPQALQRLLSSFPADFPASFLVVQHMPPRFTKSLAQRLDGLCQLSVEEAEDGMMLRHGQVLIAKADWHMTIVRQDGNLLAKLSQTLPMTGHRPSVNALFASLSSLHPVQLIAVVLTGMGTDGAAQLSVVKQCGGLVLAEDASTAVIYGMPKAAVQTGFVDHVVPLHEMSAMITRLVSS